MNPFFNGVFIGLVFWLTTQWLDSRDRAACADEHKTTCVKIDVWVPAEGSTRISNDTQQWLLTREK